MNLTKIKGLKYPDEYFIKFFFKFGLHAKQDLTYLEVGCSNGCNLMLPYQYNNDVIGVDLNENLIEYANENFALMNSKQPYKFYKNDMRTFCAKNSNINADVLVLANSIYYIPKQDFKTVLKDIKQNSLIRHNIPLFIRFRDIDDFRNDKGEVVEENSLIMQNGTTGEDGVFCAFYTMEEMVTLLKNELNLHDFETMHIRYDNIQNNTKVNNSDIVIWGLIN